DLSHLAGCLCRLLEEPGPALLEPEIILIQSAGMERWLSRELAQRRGVAANLHFPFPRAFIHQVLDEVLGADPAVARYERRALVWELFSLLGQASDDPAFAFVARNLAHDSDGSQRFRLARELTDLFDQYLTYRPQMMLRWAAGKGATKRDQQEPGGNGRGADGASPLDF